MSHPPPVLPGIRALFPDHLFDAAQAQAPRPPHFPYRHSRTASSPYPLNVVVPSHPIPSAQPLSPSSPYSATRHSPQSRGASYDIDPTAEFPVLYDADAFTDGAPKDGKRHRCRHCNKRFNRPSSLKIHMNTHTGAKPFDCPFQGCGRQFNVSSNMRRHYRNHSNSGPPDADADADGAASTHLRPPRSLSSVSPVMSSGSSSYSSRSRSLSPSDDEHDNPCDRPDTAAQPRDRDRARAAPHSHSESPQRPKRTLIYRVEVPMGVVPMYTYPPPPPPSFAAGTQPHLPSSARMAMPVAPSSRSHPDPHW